MKQTMKRIWLVLCMVLCLSALSGCSTAETVEEEIDPQILMVLQQGVPQTLDALTSLDGEELEAQIAQAEKNKDTVGLSMFTAWESVKEDLGALVSNETPAVELGEDGYIARVNAVFEQRACEFTVMVDDEFNITSVSFAPEYTMSENLTRAGLNTLLGMGTVFIVLIFISCIIGCFKYINAWENARKNKGAAAAAPAPAAPKAAAAPAPAPAPAAAAYADDTELISVIAAAIAASEGRTSADGLVVRSIKRVPRRNWR